MKKQIFASLILCLCVYMVKAQVSFKLGKVPKELLAQKEHPKESDADAAVIYQSVRSYYDYSENSGWVIHREVKKRIKVYSKEGLDYATFAVSLYVGGDEDENISGIKGVTSNLVNGKSVQTKLNKSGIFREKSNKYRDKVKITLPEVKEGSVIDIQYKIFSPYATSIDQFNFQYGIPVDYAKVDLAIPEYFIFKTYTKGYFPLDFKQSNNSRSITVSWRDNDSSSGLQGSARARSGSWNFNQKEYLITASDVPSMVAENYTNNINNYRSAIKFELTATNFESSGYKNYATSWESVASSIYKLESFGDELKKTGYFEKDIDALIASATSDKEKVALIFNFVKSKMNWNSYYGFLTDNGVRKAYKEKTGNVADINIMLTAMLRYAGLNANPVLASTKSHGIPLFPTREGFNYIISMVQLGDQFVLMDATEKFSKPNLLPERVMNWVGNIIKKDGSSVQIDLTRAAKTREMYMVNATVSEDGSMEGDLSMQCTDQMALQFRKEILPMDDEAYLESLEDHYNGIEISDYEVKNEGEITKPIGERYKFYKEDAIEIIGDKIYIDPLLMFARKENPFKSQSREYPIDFRYPSQKRYIVNIAIPEGYKVESMPEGAIMELPESMGSFKYRLGQQANKIQVTSTREINSTLVSSNYYGALKEYYNQMITKESEKIVLSKI